MINRHLVCASLICGIASLSGATALAQGALEENAQESGSSPVLEEIIVTAEKRENTVQRTPLSVTAFSGDAVQEANIKDVRSLSSFVPNLNIGEQGISSSMVMTLRGVSSTNNNPNGDPAVAFHVDGVYYARSSGANALFYDLERLEVLRGPQGTLWGRNATAGSINLVTAKPTEQLQFALDGTVGNYGQTATQGMINLPASETFAVRFSFATDQRDGYQESRNPDFPDLYDADDTALRLHALFTPNDDLSVLLSGDYFERGGAGTGMTLLNSGLSPWEIDHNVDAYTDIEATGYKLEVNYSFENMDFVSITANRQQEDNTFRDFDGNAAQVGSSLFFVDHKALSQEFRLTSTTDSNFEWLLGAYYMKEETGNRSDVFIDFAPGLPIELTVIFDSPNREADSQALFGQSFYHLTDDLKVTTGLRYTDDEKLNVDGRQTVIRGPNTFHTVENFTVSWTKTDWKLGLDWQLTDDQLLYASVGTGYKAGGANFGGVIFYDPEDLLAFEVGSKNRFLDNRAQFNLSVFNYDYEDLQVSQVVNGQNETQNAASSGIWGLESDFQFILSDNFSVDGTLSYLDGEYEDYVARNPINSTLVDVSGNSMARAPDFSANIGLEFVQEGFGGTIKGRVDYHYESETFMTEFNDLAPFDLARQDSYSRVDASLRYESMSETNWYVEVYGDNLNDEDVLTGVLIVPGGGFQASFTPPRTYGVKLGVRWE